MTKVFHSNDNQGWMWAEKGKQPIKPKTQGRGIVVSDFIEAGAQWLSSFKWQRIQQRVRITPWDVKGSQMFPEDRSKIRRLLGQWEVPQTGWTCHHNSRDKVSKGDPQPCFFSLIKAVVTQHLLVRHWTSITWMSTLAVLNNLYGTQFGMADHEEWSLVMGDQK